MNTLSRKGWRKRTPHLVPIDTKEISSLTPCLRLYIHAISSQNQISSNYNTTNRIHSLMLKRCFLQTLLVWARGRKRWHHVNRTEETNWSAGSLRTWFELPLHSRLLPSVRLPQLSPIVFSPALDSSLCHIPSQPSMVYFPLLKWIRVYPFLATHMDTKVVD